jgi:hypothetical protein
LGTRVSSAGDVDADGFADLLVSAGCSACGATQVNFVDVYSGANGAQLYHFVEPVPPSGFGSSIAAAGDIDADGFDDVLIGAPRTWPGHAYVYSGANGSLLHDLVGSVLGFGTAVSRIGDVDQDGFGDVAVSAPYLSSNIYAFSGRTGTQLWTSQGTWANYGLGTFLKSLGDVDGDGTRDLLSAASRSFTTDKLVLVSGASGALLVEARHFGNAQGIAALGDVNGDGLDDFGANGFPYFIGFPFYGVYLSNAPAPTLYCTAKTNSQGCVPYISASGPGPCLSVGDDLHIVARNTIEDTSGALIWSLSQASTPFAGGTLCIGPASTILTTRKADHIGSPCGGSFDFALRRSYLLNQGLSAGTTLYAQIISRDPGFAPPNNVGLTDALAITIAP